MSDFNVYDYVQQSGQNPHDEVEDELISFFNVCEKVKYILDEQERTEASGKEQTILKRQRQALLGYPKEVEYYKSQIRDLTEHAGMSGSWYPDWYNSLSDAVYNEILGFAGLAPWIEGRGKLKNSSSAKMIGDRIYFMVDGKLTIQVQQIPGARRRQLRASLLLATPEKRATDSYHEVYLQDGTRVTMYNEGLAKKDQDCIVFRKFFVTKYTFEEQAARGTIPQDAIPLFKAMVAVGYNVAFIGPVRSAKTTFLTTWQSHEDPTLEGVMVESDPEIPLHLIMPAAPIMQFVPTDEAFPTIIKKIMRSDADYIIMAEARDGVALDTAVKAANKGTKRVKITFHTSDAMDFCYDVADEIKKTYGDDLSSCITKVAKSFHYVFQFMQLADKSKKRLKAIWEIRYDLRQRSVKMVQICKYCYGTDSWEWVDQIGEDKKEIGYEENRDALQQFETTLKKLSDACPHEGDPVYLPSFNSLLKGVSQ